MSDYIIYTIVPIFTYQTSNRDYKRNTNWKFIVNNSFTMICKNKNYCDRCRDLVLIKLTVNYWMTVYHDKNTAPKTPSKNNSI